MKDIIEKLEKLPLDVHLSPFKRQAIVSALYPHLLAYIKAARAEYEAWRAAASTFGDRPSHPNHAHEKRGIWDGSGKACKECAAWLAAQESVAATDAARRALTEAAKEQNP